MAALVEPFHPELSSLSRRLLRVDVPEFLRKNAALAEDLAARSRLPAERQFLAALAEELWLEAARLDSGHEPHVALAPAKRGA